MPRQLPPDVRYFTDRETHLARLHSWLDTSYEYAAPAEVIAGIGGVGKTSLATHWAHQIRHRFPDGDLYVELRGFHVRRAVSAEEALDQLLRALGVPGERIPFGVDARAALYRSLLHDRRMLIILDNVATVEQIRPLLPGSPTCRVLVTSRNELTGLMVRDGAQRISLDVLPPERANELLAQIAGADRLRDNPAATADLIRYCGYLPLALRIVAERLAGSPRLSVAEVVEELAEARDRLDALTTEDDEFTTVRAVFSWSYQALPADAARMFRLLGLPAGPDISTSAAGVTEAKARRLLDKLVGAHLLQRHGSGRYRFHDLLRVYAAECADTDESTVDRRAAVHRLLAWYAYAVNTRATSLLHISSAFRSTWPSRLPRPRFPTG